MIAQTERFTFFWQGPFSQWHRCSFSLDGVTYNCAEQFMMHQKAVLFGDTEIAAAILNAADPKAQKALGRRVSGFDETHWNEVARRIVYVGNRAKFTQNDALKAKILATSGTTLVEASPYDAVWGIGLSATDPRAQSRNTWKGKNWLGEVLTALRDRLHEKST